MIDKIFLKIIAFLCLIFIGYTSKCHGNSFIGLINKHSESDKLSLSDWFMSEVLPHQSALLGYMSMLTRKDIADVSDLVQESLTRVYTAAKTKRPTEAKNFLFVTARNLYFDEVRRAKIVTINTIGDQDIESFDSNAVIPETQVSAGQEWKMLNQAMDNLTPKCKEVIVMRRVYGYSQRETAQKLNLSEASVESHIKRGIVKLSQTFRKLSESAEKQFFSKGSHNHQGARGK